MRPVAGSPSFRTAPRPEPAVAPQVYGSGLDTAEGTLTPPRSAPSTPPDSRFLLTLSREYAVWSIQLADTKANILLAASAVLAGLLAQQAVSACDEATRMVMSLAIGLVLASAATAAFTLIPRTKSRQRATLLYYQGALAYATGDAYYERVKGLTAEEADRELAVQVWELAHIEKRKYAWLRRGFALFGTALPVILVGVVWARLLCA